MEKSKKRSQPAGFVNLIYLDSSNRSSESAIIENEWNLKQCHYCKNIEYEIEEYRKHQYNNSRNNSSGNSRNPSSGRASSELEQDMSYECDRRKRM